MSMGKRIEKRRKQLGLTQEDLASALKMRQAAISRLEHDGVPNPGAEMLKRLALALHCSIDWLVGLYDDDTFTMQPRREPVSA